MNDFDTWFDDSHTHDVFDLGSNVHQSMRHWLYGSPHGLNVYKTPDHGYRTMPLTDQPFHIPGGSMSTYTRSRETGGPLQDLEGPYILRPDGHRTVSIIDLRDGVTVLARVPKQEAIELLEESK